MNDSPKGTLPAVVRLMANAAIDAVIISDPGLRVLYFNQNAADLAGLRPREIRKAKFQGMCHTHFRLETCEGGQCVARRALDTGKSCRVDEVRSGVFPIRLIVLAIPLVNDDGEIYAVLEQYRDVTAESRMQDHYKRLLESERRQKAALKVRVDQQKELAQTDGLTCLANRRHFDQMFSMKISAAMQSEKPLTLALFDLDHFKQVNDTYGHQAGDEVLKTFASILKQSTRSERDVVARCGGEEFTVLMSDADLEQARQVAERVRARARKVELLTTASSGLACYPEDGTTEEALFGAADRALYAAKSGGRDRVVAARELDRG